MNFTLWICSCRNSFEKPRPFFGEDAFGHKGSGGVFDRQEQHIVHAVTVANRTRHRQNSTTHTTEQEMVTFRPDCRVPALKPIIGQNARLTLIWVKPARTIVLNGAYLSSDFR